MHYTFLIQEPQVTSSSFGIESGPKSPSCNFTGVHVNALGKKDKEEKKETKSFLNKSWPRPPSCIDIHKNHPTKKIHQTHTQKGIAETYRQSNHTSIPTSLTSQRYATKGHNHLDHLVQIQLLLIRKKKYLKKKNVRNLLLKMREVCGWTLNIFFKHDFSCDPSQSHW